MARYEDLPYRPCVGMMVLNRDGRVFVGRRFDGPEQVDGTYPWQMPQGGLDPGEEPYPAALRELAEETNITSVDLLAEAPEWFFYDLPLELVPHAWGGRYRGQKQKWYALRFTGPAMALGADAPASRPDHPVQAQRLRTGRRHVREFIAVSMTARVCFNATRRRRGL